MDKFYHLSQTLFDNNTILTPRSVERTSKATQWANGMKGFFVTDESGIEWWLDIFANIYNMRNMYIYEVQVLGNAENCDVNEELVQWFTEDSIMIVRRCVEIEAEWSWVRP